VPGHEFTGVVTETGPEVTRFSVGDHVAVGNIVDSCGECSMCKGIAAEIELLPSAQVNEALARLRRNDVRYRFVLDMSDLS
jgi:D-arabinose 1-dehydrogenase-like Zn-dependent alcohol dehydrogenase